MTNNNFQFFSLIRVNVFNGKLNIKQFEGINVILLEWNKRNLTDLRWLAYILATVFHETAATMQPIEEFGKGKNKDYGKKLDVGRGPGKRVPYTIPDKLYYGRGHTQNTWLTIYRRLTTAAKKQGYNWDFVNNPELLLTMEPSIWATFHSMLTGLYTGKSLSNYFNLKVEDWVNARRIINGLDKAILISNLSKKFYDALVNTIGKKH